MILYIRLMDIFLVLALLLLLTACAHSSKKAGQELEMATRQEPEMAALQELEEAMIPFSKEAFLTRVLDGDTQVVEVFLTAGMDVNVQDEEGNIALILAAYHGHTAMVQDLLHNGARVNEKTDYGRTALMLATQNRHPEIVQFLN